MTFRGWHTHSTGNREHFNAEVVANWGLLLFCKIVLFLLTYWSLILLDFVSWIRMSSGYGCWVPFILFFCSDGTFYLWETNTWTSESWSSTSGFVTVNKNDVISFSKVRVQHTHVDPIDELGVGVQSGFKFVMNLGAISNTA